MIQNPNWKKASSCLAIYNRARGSELRTTVNKSRQQVVKIRSAVSPLVHAVSFL